MVIQELKYIGGCSGRGAGGGGSGHGAGGGRGIKISGLSIKAVTATLMNLVLYKNDPTQLLTPGLDAHTLDSRNIVYDDKFVFKGNFNI